MVRRNNRYFYDIPIKDWRLFLMLKLLNESSDTRIYQHVQQGDIVAFITAFRGMKRTLMFEPDFLQKVFGVKYPGGEWFDEKDVLHLPYEYDKPGYYKQAYQALLKENRERNKRFRSVGIKWLEMSFIMLEGHYSEGKEDVTEEVYVIFAEPKDWKDLRKFLKDACVEFEQESATLVREREAYYIYPDKPDKKIGGIHMRPKELGQCYSRIRGKNFRFGEIKEEYKGRRHFDNISEAQCYYSGKEIFDQAIKIGVNYFRLLDIIQEENERADREFLERVRQNEKRHRL